LHFEDKNGKKRGAFEIPQGRGGMTADGRLGAGKGIDKGRFFLYNSRNTDFEEDAL
jgi:hypothetical protein